MNALYRYNRSVAIHPLLARFELGLITTLSYRINIERSTYCTCTATWSFVYHTVERRRKRGRRDRLPLRISEVVADPRSDVNHVPDDVVTALDGFGEGHLRGNPSPVSERLRLDLRLRITPLDDDSTALCRFETKHTRTPEVLRDRGSFLATYVDGVDDRLRAWGIDPPDAYEYVDTVDGWHRYAGTLRLP